MTLTSTSPFMLLSAFAVGLIMAFGLVLGGMTLPEKVVAFLDVTGAWDPSLLFVLGGAMVTNLGFTRLVLRRHHVGGGPVFGLQYLIPTRRDLTGRLVAGALMFGAGWGLVGFCPGPAVVSLVTGAAPVLTFIASMIAGMLLYHWWDRAAPRRRVAAPPAQAPSDRAGAGPDAVPAESGVALER